MSYRQTIRAGLLVPDNLKASDQHYDTSVDVACFRLCQEDLGFKGPFIMEDGKPI